MLARRCVLGTGLRPSAVPAPAVLTAFSRSIPSARSSCRPGGSTPWVAAGSAAGLAYAAQPQEPVCAAQQLSTAGIVDVHKKCRTLLMILGGVAAWAYLSAGQPGSPLASMSLAIPMGPGGSAELAAKSAWTGLATGVFHTLCGPDHLAGLAPLSIGRGRLAACALGTLWGFGHSTGQLILGLVFAMLKDKFHDLMPALDKWSAYIVPLTLISIGLIGLYESHNAKQEEAPVLALEGAGAAGATGPSSVASVASTSKEGGERVGFTTYFTGIVHGLQPDALYVVIPALALPTKLAAVCFITMFVIGTCAAMGGYTLLIGTTSKALIKEQPWLQSHLSSIACGFAILCGILMLLAGQGVPVPIFS